MDLGVDCKRFTSCSANLCPLDSEIEERRWFVGEGVCKRKDFAHLPMIRRQRQLNRTRPGKYMDRPLKASWLATTWRAKRTLSDEEKEKLRKRLQSSSGKTLAQNTPVVGGILTDETGPMPYPLEEGISQKAPSQEHPFCVDGGN